MALTPETQRALMDILKVKQPESIAAPISPYEAIQMDKGLLSTDPVISKLQKVGRGVKSLLEPETPVDYLMSGLGPAKAVKTVGKDLVNAGLVKAGENLADATQRLRNIVDNNTGNKSYWNDYMTVRKVRDNLGHDVVLKNAGKNVAVAKNTSSDSVDTSYRMAHQPRGVESDSIRLDNLTKDISGDTAGYPSDFYGPQGQRYYAPGPRFKNDEYGIANQQSYDIITKVKNNPNATVTMYRGVPKGIKDINEGDFVTLSPKYAELHAASGYGRSGDEAGEVISQKVKVKDLMWDATDVNEFGYFPTNK